MLQLISAIKADLQAEPEKFFVPQFATKEGIETEIGNRDTADTSRPEWNWCGMCCARMVLLALGREAPDLADMYTTATQTYHVYRLEAGQLVGAYHKELAHYIQAEFGLTAKTERGLDASAVVDLVRNGMFVLASVSPQIRHLEGEAPTSKSGHFVLIYGVEITEGNEIFFRLHNSTGFHRLQSQIHVRMPLERFRNCFSGNAILVHP